MLLGEHEIYIAGQSHDLLFLRGQYLLHANGPSTTEEQI